MNLNVEDVAAVWLHVVNVEVAGLLADSCRRFRREPDCDQRLTRIAGKLFHQFGNGGHEAPPRQSRQTTTPIKRPVKTAHSNQSRIFILPMKDLSAFAFRDVLTQCQA